MQLCYRAEIPEKGKGPERNGSRPCLVRESIAVSPGGGKRKAAASVCTGGSRCPPDICIYMGSTPFLLLPDKKKPPKRVAFSYLEQGTGIEPAFTAWEAVVLPIYEPCIDREGIIADPEGKCNHFLSCGSPWLWQKRKKQAAFSENPNIF